MDALLGVSALVFPVAPPMGYAPSIEGKAGALLAEKIVNFVLRVPMLREPLFLLYRKIFTIVPSLLNLECYLVSRVFPDKLLL